MQIKPDWVPDWQNESDYPNPATTTPQQWAWEFLRRSPYYQRDYSEFEDAIESDILRQAKKRFITDETAQRFLQCFKDHGKDCLRLKLKSPATKFAGGYVGEPEYRMWMPYFFDNIPDRNTMSFDELTDNWDKIIPEIRVPAYVKYLMKWYVIYYPIAPANNTPPHFIGEVNPPPFVPIAVPHPSVSCLRYLQPETENEIAFMVDLKKPIKKQISFIKKLCMELKVKTKDRETTPPKIEWLKQLRLLDAIEYGPSDAKRTLAKEWGCTVGNLNTKHREAKMNRDVGYRRMVLYRESTLNSDAVAVASDIKSERLVSKLDLDWNFDKEIDQNIRRRELEKLRKESLKRIRTKSKKQ